jgi:enterochelin esterase-like enzyme
MPKPEGPRFHDAYAKWIEEVLVPRARREVPTIETPERTYLCGVSLGGYVSLEVLVRLPHVFGAWAGVQTAIAPGAAPAYAKKIAAGWAGEERDLLVLTSSQDHWKKASDALDAAFTEKKLRHAYRVTPGPHDQPWLRESGTLEMMLWLDRLSWRKA